MCLRALHACSVHGAPSHTQVFIALVSAILGQSFPWKNRSLHIFFFFLAVLSCPEVCVCQGGGGEREGGSWGGVVARQDCFGSSSGKVLQHWLEMIAFLFKALLGSTAQLDSGALQPWLSTEPQSPANLQCVQRQQQQELSIFSANFLRGLSSSKTVTLIVSGSKGWGFTPFWQMVFWKDF